MNLRRTTLRAAAAAIFLSCSASLDDSAGAEDATGAPVITTLQLRDGALAITSTDRGVRYGVRDAAGHRRANLTLEELERSNPDLRELVQTAVAASDGAYIDARLDPMAPDDASDPTDAMDSPNALGRVESRRR